MFTPSSNDVRRFFCEAYRKQRAGDIDVFQYNQLKEAAAEAEDVICPACGETSPGNFANCWNCGAPLLAEGAD